MKMSIEDKIIKQLSNSIKVLQKTNSEIAEAYDKLKTDYENQLKADMVAMLTEIQLEIEELDFFEGEEPLNITQELIDEVKSWEYGVKDCKKLIQQKINALKSESKG